VYGHRISTYHVFISHRYAHSDEYRRLVAMLDRAAHRDPTWRWRNCSIPVEAPVMTDDEAGRAEVYEARIRERLTHVHVILYIARRDWLGDLDSIYIELVETTPRYRAPVPIINVLPRGADARSPSHRGPGVTTVNWHPKPIINAIRQHALPASAGELRLTRAEADERRQIVAALSANAGHLRTTALALGVSLTTLRRKRLQYIIPPPNRLGVRATRRAAALPRGAGSP
jgi:hypothetical protein